MRAQSITGIWQGTLPVDRNARIVVRISALTEGGLRGVYNLVDIDADGYLLSTVVFHAPEVQLTSDLYAVSFRGKLAADGSSLSGTWTQSNKSYPLVLTRTTPEAAWRHGGGDVIPAMAVKADPAFEVATIKPSRPESKGLRYEVRTRQFRAFNASVIDLMRFAFDVRPRQIAGAPAWTSEERFDIAAEPDVPGLPSLDQWHAMMRKLLAERFGLTFHTVEQGFPVYALTVQGGSPKIKQGDPALGMDGHIVGENQPGGDMLVRFSSESMPEFVGILMNFVDRQVLDETGLSGRYDFVLTLSNAVLVSGDAGEKTAEYMRAVQPLGLRLVPKTADLKVLVVDRLEQPSEN